MNLDPSPPKWADYLLRSSLSPRDVDSVSGDLLEEYRLRVVPMRGKRAGDVWYVAQAVSFAWRSAGVFALIFALVFLTRTAIDWRIPTSDFSLRSAVVTGASVAVFLLAGLRGGARSGSVANGALVALATALFAAPVQILGVLALLTLWHDPATLAAIERSGGLAEAVSFPVLTVIPAVAIGAAGAILGVFGTRFRAT